MTIVVYRATVVVKILINILNLFFKLKVYKYNYELKLPQTNDYYKINRETNIKITDYFKKIKNKNISDNLILYLKKKYSLYSHQYSAFNFAINNKKFNNLKIIAPNAFKRLFRKKKKNFFGIIIDNFIIVFSLIKFNIFFAKSFFITFFTFQKLNFKKIIFLRKKNIEDKIGNRLQLNLNDDVSLVVPIFSKTKPINDYYFLNNYLNLRQLITFYLKTNIYFFSNLFFFYKCILYFRFQEDSVGGNVLYELLRDFFISSALINTKTLIYTGILVDKPLHLLIDLNRLKKQKIISLNESFIFKPKDGFDYNLLYKYYSLNKYDKENINLNGGKIENFHNVNFFRKELYKIKISKKTLDYTKNYKKIILITSCQIYHHRYSNYNIDDLKYFISNIFKVAKLYPNYLFILKEKKSEFDQFNNFDYEEKKLKNILSIRCSNPKKLLYDNFDSLLSLSDLVISMAYESTTIWQSFVNSRKFMIFGRYTPDTFLNNYKNLVNTDKNQLLKSIDYWINISEINYNKFKNELSQETNICVNKNSDGIKDIAIDLKRDIEEISNYEN